MKAKMERKKYKARTRWSHLDTAEEMIGDLNDGDLFFGITCGNVSKVDIIEHCINQVEGEVKLMIATWTVAEYDATKIEDLLTSGKVSGLQMIVDRSFASRQRRLSDSLIQRFGENVIKYQRIHAKMFCVLGEDKSICCFTSMNLNENKRFENFVINVNNEVVEKALDFFDVVFQVSPAKCESGYKFLSEDFSAGVDDEELFNIETDDLDLGFDFDFEI